MFRKKCHTLPIALPLNSVFRWERLFRPDNEVLSQVRKFAHRNYYYNVVSYIYIPLVPEM